MTHKSIMSKMFPIGVMAMCCWKNNKDNIIVNFVFKLPGVYKRET